MKPRDFHLRLDQTPGANLRRLHAYIRSIQPDYQPATKLMMKEQMKAEQKARQKAQLRRVK